MWFGGHHLPGYGVMFPVLAARLGVTTVAIVSCVVAATCFQSLAGHPQRWRTVAASTLFAAGTVVNVAVGRLTFALGLAVGLAALAALRRHHRIVGTALVVATPLASPVAGVMLALALAVVAMHERRWRPAMLAAAAMVPIAVAAVAFPEGGRFPFRPAAVAWTLLAVSAVAVVTDRRVVRLGAVAYAVACMATFVVANPLGANVTRLGMFVAAPLVVLTARPRRVAIAALAVPALIWWQWSPALDGIVRAGRDPSSVAAYHEPLVAAVASFGPLDGRVEVVPTRRHWETVYVASEVPLARGWERQLDIGRNAISTRTTSTGPATTVGCSTTPCATSPSPMSPSIRPPAPRPTWYADGRRTCRRSGATSTGCCTASSMPDRSSRARPASCAPARPTWCST